MMKNALEWPRPIKRLVVVILDATMGLIAMWLAFTLRLETLHWPDEGMQWLAYLLAPVLSFPIFVNQGLYRAIFRYTGINALITTGKAVALYGALLFAILLIGQWPGIPRSVGILQPLIFLLLVGSSRALGWLWLAGTSTTPQHRLLIYGAGSAGAQTAAGLMSARNYTLKAFADDDPQKAGRSINGVRVYAPTAMTDLVKHLGITDVLLALPSVSRQRRRQIIETLRDLPVRIRTLPGLTDLASGKITIADFQDLDIEDLLGRDVVAGTPELLTQNLKYKVILVTGAGGSIGSELCRQIVRENPKQLLLVEHSEFALYSIHQELSSIIQNIPETSCSLVPLLANVCDDSRMSEICRQYQPSSIYHAAAYKHVPMVEANISEGIRNNVFGTLSMVRVALDYKVQNFVLISTDKAVRPTNVMGASKRVAEMLLQSITASQQPPFIPQPDKRTPLWKSPTQFSIVRFGNVLGSSGSVIPLFRRQIEQGGPITVTHPEVTRYFMTIPEAAQLVLQASAMAEGGDVFVLDMGSPIKILDLARRMITLSGLTVRDENHPDGDISIIFNGLRPGEKLYEELLIGNNPLTTEHARIMRAREEFCNWSELQIWLQSLQNASLINDEKNIRHILTQIVNGYQPETCIS